MIKRFFLSIARYPILRVAILVSMPVLSWSACPLWDPSDLNGASTSVMRLDGNKVKMYSRTYVIGTYAYLRKPWVSSEFIFANVIRDSRPWVSGPYGGSVQTDPPYLPILQYWGAGRYQSTGHHQVIRPCDTLIDVLDDSPTWLDILRPARPDYAAMANRYLYYLNGLTYLESIPH
jgi:hypothetical protein